MNYSTEILLTDMRLEFVDFGFSYIEIDYSGTIPCFFINADSEDRLCHSWMKISDFIAVNYQSKLDNEFSIWNIYLFYLVRKTIENDLKYLIGNDTFSSRKIVIEGNTNFNKILEEHILNNDIKIDISKAIENDFIPNSIFFDQISDIEVKSKVTNEIKDAYFQIISDIKEAHHEI